MISLSQQIPMSGGDDRLVFLDPSDSSRCIKIARINYEHDFKPRGFNETLYWLFRGGQLKFFDHNYVDAEYAAHLSNRGSENSFNHIPRCYGWVETDLGPGVCWEYITNDEGQRCRSLKDYSDNPDLLGEKERVKLWSGLNTFFSWQLNELVLLREIAYTNTLVQERGNDHFHLYPIDAIGCADLIPLARVSRFVATLRIRSKVGRFRQRMVKWLGPPPQ